MDFNCDPALLDSRLAVYGELAPGKSVHYQIERLRGIWVAGMVRGRLTESWTGFPALIIDPRAQAISVDVLFSPDLPSYWPMLDVYEGFEYRRVSAPVETVSGACAAFIYEAAPAKA